MTRKDYELIARAMKKELRDGANPYDWMSIVNGLASALKEDNERFDRHTFRNACGWVECTGVESERA
jgi:hypothetical protein